MKKIAIIIFLLSTTFSYSQNYTKKYNYVQPVNLDLVNKVLSSKQNSYDRNVSIVNNRIMDLEAKLFDYFSYDKDKRKDAMERWNYTKNVVASWKTDYSSASKTNEVLSILNSVYYQYIDMIENP